MLLLIEGRIASLEEAFFCTKEQLEAETIDVALEETLLEIFPSDHRIRTDKRELSYDRLVLAAGSSQDSTVLPQPEEALLTYKEYEAAKYFLQQLPQAESITIVGAGQAGMEAANTLTAIGKKSV